MVCTFYMPCITSQNVQFGTPGCTGSRRLDTWLCGPGEEEPPDDYTGPFSMRPMQNRVGFEADRKRAASWLAWITFGINCFFALITDCPFAGIAVGLFPSVGSITFFLDARNGICQLHCGKGQQVSDIAS